MNTVNKALKIDKELINSLINSQSIVQYENKKKEEYINRKIENIERDIKELEVDYITKLNIPNKSKLEHLFLRRFYNELEEIDNLFVKVDYLDPKSANLLMDDIDDRVDQLKQDIKKVKNSTVIM